MHPRRDKLGMALPKLKSYNFSLRLNPPSKNAEGGWRFAVKIQCDLGGPKYYINKSGASKLEITYRDFDQYYTVVYLYNHMTNYIGPSSIHSEITTDSSSSNIMRSNSSMTLRTATSNISSASLRRYASNLGPAINDGSHQSP